MYPNRQYHAAYGPAAIGSIGTTSAMSPGMIDTQTTEAQAQGAAYWDGQVTFLRRVRARLLRGVRAAARRGDTVGVTFGGAAADAVRHALSAAGAERSRCEWERL